MLPVLPPHPVRKLAALAAVLNLLIVPYAHSQREAVERAWAFGQQAVEAYEAGDYDAYLTNLRDAAALRPNHPDLVYRIAGAYALTGQPDEAVAWLNRYAAMGLVAAPADDSTFESVKAVAGFADVLALIERNAQPVGRSVEAFRLADPAFIPEGLAHDPATGAFFVASVHQRRIVRVDAEGREEDFAGAGQDGLWSVLGLAVDAGRRRLWACSAALVQTKDVPEDDLGRSGLWRYDLDTGALLQHYLLPPDGQQHALGDLTLNEQGDVFVTDARSGALYVLRDGSDQFEAILEPGRLVSPQGLCFLGGDGPLVVADYSLGLLRIDVEARQATVIPPPADVTLLGIDGLACFRDRLLAIQNGVRPHRVMQFTINQEADAVLRAEVLEANHPRFIEPTLGTVVGETYYYIANSQWNKFDENGQLPDASQLQAPVILTMRLMGF